ncbi:hypothetical protein Tco_0457767 [Tanacetum coccineum]
MKEILGKFINEEKRKHEEVETFIIEFRTTNELLLKEQNNLLSELRIEVHGLSKVMNDVLILKNEVKGPEEPRDGILRNKSQKINETISQHSVEIQVPSISFPHRLRKEKEEAQQRKFLENLKQLHINIPFIRAIVQMPGYAKFLKSLLTNKSKIEEACTVTMNERCFAVLLNKLPSKEKDPGSFTIPFHIVNLYINNAIETHLFDYETPLCTEFKEFNHFLKVDTELFTHDIERTKTYEDYESELNNEVGEPWSNDGVPYELCDHICEPFRFKNGKTKWPTCNSNEDGFCNSVELPGMVRVVMVRLTQKSDNLCAWLKRSFGNFHELDYELLVKLEECWWKINDHECSPFANWIDRIRRPYANINTTHDPYLDGRNSKACNNSDVQEEEEQHNKEQCDFFDGPT